MKTQKYNLNYNDTLKLHEELQEEFMHKSVASNGKAIKTNLMIMTAYCVEKEIGLNTNEFKTFNQWKNEGLKVKKGEKAIKLHKPYIKKNEEQNSEEIKGFGLYKLPKFHILQVEEMSDKAKKYHEEQKAKKQPEENEKPETEASQKIEEAKQEERKEAIKKARQEAKERKEQKEKIEKEIKAEIIEEVQEKEAFKIEEIIGHMVKAKIVVEGLGGYIRQLQELEGRIIYSVYQEAYMFMKKGARNKGILIDINDIKEIEILKKDNQKHKEEKEKLNKKEELIKEKQERQREEHKRQEEERERQREEREKAKQERIKKDLEEAKSQEGGEELEREVKEAYGEKFHNNSFINENVLPLLSKLINKNIENVDDYPKYYFSKKDNPIFTGLIEKKLNIKLPNTQKGAVKTINEYLKKAMKI